MVNIIKQEIEIETALKNKIEFICSFCNTTPTIHNGSIRTIEHTNLTYVEPHRVIINGITYLAFNYEPTHSILMMLKHSQIKDFAEEINLNFQQLGKEIWSIDDLDLIYFNSQDEDGNWYSILKPGLDIEDIKYNYVYRGSFELWQVSTMPNALEKLNIEFVNGKMQKIEKERQKHLSLVLPLNKDSISNLKY